MTNDSADEIGIEAGRAKLGDIVARAEYAGATTYLTRHGRRVAAVVPLPLNPTADRRAAGRVIAESGGYRELREAFDAYEAAEPGTEAFASADGKICSAAARLLGELNHLVEAEAAAQAGAPDRDAVPEAARAAGCTCHPGACTRRLFRDHQGDSPGCMACADQDPDQPCLAAPPARPVLALVDDLPDAALPAAADYVRRAAGAVAARQAADEAAARRPAAPGAGRRILCAHADQDGAGMHWLEPGETCPLAAPEPAAEPAPAPARRRREPKLPRITDTTGYELVKAPDYADSGSWLVMIGGVRAGLVRRAYEGTGSGHVWEAVDNSLMRVHCYGKGATPHRNARTRDKAAAELVGMLRRRQRDAR